MKKLLFVLVAMFLCSNAFAIDFNCPPQTYAFGRFSFSDEQLGEYRWSWGRVGTKFFPQSQWGTLTITAEADVSDGFTTKYYNVCIPTQQVNLSLGKYLCPVQYNWPGPRTVRTIGWDHVEGSFSTYCTGVLAHSKSELGEVWGGIDKQGFSFLVTNSGVSVFFESEVGAGFSAEHQFHPYLNLKGGLAVLLEENGFGTDQPLFLEYWANKEDWRIGLILNGGEGMRANSLSTVDYAFGKNSSVFVGYDSAADTFRAGVNVSS